MWLSDEDGVLVDDDESLAVESSEILTLLLGLYASTRPDLVLKYPSVVYDITFL